MTVVVELIKSTLHEGASWFGIALDQTFEAPHQAVFLKTFTIPEDAPTVRLPTATAASKHITSLRLEEETLLAIARDQKRARAQVVLHGESGSDGQLQAADGADLALAAAC